MYQLHLNTFIIFYILNLLLSINCYLFTLQIMSENTLNQEQPSGKPVNINISFNISRKQVTQNINSMDQQKSFNVKNPNMQQNLAVNNKPANHSSRPLKTPQLAQTDRHVYSKNLQNMRATQQLKRKKRRKRNSVDYVIDKTADIPFYALDLDKSLPTHKRGYTTTTMNKNKSSTKCKKQTVKLSNNTKQGDSIPISSIVNPGMKNDGKTEKLQKNLKIILSKLINNELSKRSLPLPSVPSKSKYYQSTALTARKMSSARPSKKRSSKSHMMSKSKQPQLSQSIDSSASERQIFENPRILEKLGNFRSIQNSVLISEADNVDNTQQQSPKQKNTPQKKIVIKTDQSIQCMDEIHNWERNFYREEFFDETNKNKNKKTKANQLQLGNASTNTYKLIQKYITMLNRQHDQSYKMSIDEPDTIHIPPHNVNQRVEVYEDDKINHSDYRQMRQQPKCQNKKNEDKYDKYRNTYQSGRDFYQKYIKKEQPKTVAIEQPLSNKQQKTQKQIYQVQNVTISTIKKQSINQSNNEDDNFRPFISSEMGRQIHSRAPSNSEQRARLNQLKKHEIQKWGNLLEYIKSNMNSQISTQQVLQQVYDYLSKAKVDLIREGQSISLGQSNGKQRCDLSAVKNKERLQEEFTNKLSSQIERSEQELSLRQVSQNQADLHSYTKGKQPPSTKKLNERLKSQEEQILDQQANSFKQDYESSVEQESLKFMNLSTIQTALKNRFNQLNHKRQKQIQYLDDLLEQNQISEIQHEEQIVQIENLFKKETNQILMVKKNIWKGYNEAKGILDKSYITSRVEEQFGNYRFNDGLSDKKERKMMKCLSESYLSKKKIDYKKFIEEEEKKRQQQTQKYHPKRQHHQEETHQQDQSYESEDQQYEDQGNQYDEEQQAFPAKQSEDPSNSRIQSSQHSQSVHSTNKVNGIQRKLDKSQSHSIDEEFQQITEKINKLKIQHEQSVAQDHKQPQPSSEASPQRQSLSVNGVNQFSLQDHKYLQQDGNGSPVIVQANFDTSMQYEEIEKSFHTSSDEDKLDEQDEDLESDDRQDDLDGDSKDQIGEIKHSSDQEDRDEYQQDEEYSQEEQQIIDEEFSGTTANSLTNTMHSPPLQSSLQQLKQQDLEQPTIKGKKQNKEINQTLLTDKLKSEVQNPKVKTLTQKFKYLTQEDRQDIFQFLFLDLCIELYQQQCHQNRIMDSINRYVTKQYQMAKRKKGVKTNLNVVKDYLKRFCGYLIRTNKPVLQNMNVPMGPTAIEMLKYMHENDEFAEEAIQQNDGVVTLIVPVTTFDTFERTLLPTLEFQKYYDNEEKEHERVNFLKNILHIHNKALFDALNQFLDHERPFGIWGKPFPWKKSSSFCHKFTQVEQQQKLKKSAQKVVEACSYVCGLLVDKQQSLVGSAKISQGYIQQIREDRISRMLANEMIESEERWVFYDDEQTQVLVEASNFIQSNLLKQIMQELTALTKRQVQ